jgi:hypothetical protein
LGSEASEGVNGERKTPDVRTINFGKPPFLVLQDEQRLEPLPRLTQQLLVSKQHCGIRHPADRGSFHAWRRRRTPDEPAYMTPNVTEKRCVLESAALTKQLHNARESGAIQGLVPRSPTDRTPVSTQSKLPMNQRRPYDLAEVCPIRPVWLELA